MDPQQIQELLDKLFEIGGAIASKGWELAVRQVYVGMAADVVWLLLCAGIIVAAVRWLPRLAKRRDDVLDMMAIEGVLGLVLGGCAAVGAAIGAVSLLSDIAARAINPEWYAVRLLLGVVR